MINTCGFSKTVIVVLLVATTIVGCWKNATESRPDPDPTYARIPQPPENTQPPPALGEELSTFPGVSIQRVETEPIFRGLPGRKWELVGDLMTSLQYVCPLEIRVLQETPFPDGTYRITGKVPDDVFPGKDKIDITRIDWEPVYEAIREAYVTTFGLRIAEEARTIDVYTLTAPNGKPEAFVPATVDEDSLISGPTWGTDHRDGVSGCRFDRMSMTRLMMWLESQLGVFVVDETELAGRYDFFLSIRPYITDRPTVKQATAALDKVGLSLQPAQREVKFLVIGPGDNTPAAP